MSHCAQLAAVYPGSPMLARIASRRQIQSVELTVFLAKLSQRTTDTAQRENNYASTATAQATAAWFDFPDGWSNLAILKRSWFGPRLHVRPLAVCPLQLPLPR